MSALIDRSQFSQLAAGELQGKIRTSISVVPNGRLGSREGPPRPAPPPLPKHDDICIWWVLGLLPPLTPIRC